MESCACKDIVTTGKNAKNSPIIHRHRLILAELRFPNLIFIIFFYLYNYLQINIFQKTMDYFLKERKSKKKKQNVY